MSDWTDAGLPGIQETGYGYSFDLGMRRSAVQTALPNQRVQYKAPRRTIRGSLILTQAQAESFRSYLDSTAFSWHTIPLVTGDGFLTDHNARLIAGPQMSALGNGYWRADLQLETKIDTDAANTDSWPYSTTDVTCCDTGTAECCEADNICFPYLLTDWSAEYYGWPGADDGQWDLAVDGLSVTLNDSNPNNTEGTSFFVGDVSSVDANIIFTCSVEQESDDDYLGLAIGYNSGDVTNASADFLLFAWKQATQGCASAGTMLCRVQGVPTTIDPLFCPSGVVTQLERGLNYGSTGWTEYVDYNVAVATTATTLRIYINGALEFNYAGTIPEGVFAFYNCSQRGVTYAIQGCSNL